MAVQPAPVVTVIVYVPGTDTVGLGRMELKFCGPVHATALADGEKTGLSINAVCEQVSVPPDTDTCGKPVSAVTVAVAVPVQPLGAVARKVYVPATDTSGCKMVEVKFCGPVHNRFALAGDTVAASVSWGCKHVNNPPAALS